jgi:hypothetical protein
VQERYEPGDEVTLVGYVIGDGSLGSADDGPFFAYLRPTSTVSDGADGLPELAPFTPRATDITLGAIDLAATGKGGYLEYRAAIRFTLPRDLTPGRYPVVYCNADCTKGIGDLIGGWVNVGVDPLHPLFREWPTDEPEIANLAPDAVLSGPGWQRTAEEVRMASAPAAPIQQVPGTVRTAKHLQRKLSVMTSVQRRGTVLCAADIAIHVYEFETAAARQRATVDVRRNQASVPNYFARGKVIAVVRGNDAKLLDQMTAVMGPTITPDAVRISDVEVCSF